MRNNQERMNVTGEPPTDNLQPNTDVPPVSNSMQFIVPTEVIMLPSKGLFYQEGHPLYQRETVEIRHMTTKEEDILTNQSYLKNGTIIDKLLQSILIEPKMNVKDMLLGDKNALLIACRIYGYGPEYETRYACPSCGTNQNHTFDLEEVEHIDFMSNLSEFEAEVDYDRELVVLPIPRTNTRLELRLLKEEASDFKKKKKSLRNAGQITKQYEKMISSVNGNSDIRYIRSYIGSMSALDSRYLRAAYSKITPGVDFQTSFECRECDFEDAVEVPLTAEFFWPKS